MTKMVLHIAICTFILSACNLEDSTPDKQNRIEVGDYSFQFPKEYKLIKENGVDSYVGKISNGKINFQFDCGYYSNSLDKSIDEFLSADVWKWNALGKYDLPADRNMTEIVKKIKLIGYNTSDSVNYTLRFLYKSDTIEYDLKIPEELKKLKIDIDTVDNIRYKFVRSNDYVGLYAKDLKSFNKSINSYMALSIVAVKLGPEETGKCYEILKSCKPKKR